MTAKLALNNVSKTYGEGPARVEALREVDLSVRASEMVAIMGPSGSGKSTMLTIAGALERPTSGQVVVDGDELGALSQTELASIRRTALGFVFQEFNLLAGLTAVENIAMPLELEGWRRLDAREQALECLATVGLSERADHFPDDLSGGERQRVAIARAIVGERNLVLADEPTGALDGTNGESVMRVLRSIADRGSAVVIVTHDAHLAAWADRVVFIRDGRIVGESTPTGPESLLAAAHQ